MTQADKKSVTDRLNNIGMVTPTLSKGPDELIDTGRDIPELVEYIGQQLRVGGEAAINAGMGLIEAKRKLHHGEWGTWLAEHFGLSARQAQRLMVIARNYGTNPTLASHLGQTKALALLALPESEREEFISEKHIVDGEEKDVIDMSARELDKVIKERDEARKTAEQAKADAEAAEKSRASMEESLKTANELLYRAEMDKERADGSVAELKRQIAELKSAPVEVAVMQVDQEALDKARAEGEAAKAEELAQLRSQLDKAKEGKKRADEKRKNAEASVDILKRSLEEAAKAKAQSAAMADLDVVKLQVCFEQGKTIANVMSGILLKFRNRGDQVNVEKASRVMAALGDAIKEAAQ